MAETEEEGAAAAAAARPSCAKAEPAVARKASKTKLGGRNRTPRGYSTQV